MRCESIRELLSAAADGEAEAGELRLIESHLGSCAECRGRAKLYAGMKRAVRAAPLPAVPGELRQGLLRQARQHQPQPGFGGFLRAWRLPLGAAAGAFAAAALLLFVKFGAEEPLPVDFLLNAHSRYALALSAGRQ